MLSIQLLGTPSFRILGRLGGVEFGHSGRLLGSFLFAFANQPFRRDYLQDLFWGDLPVERARAAMNTAVWRLRKTLGDRLGVPGGCLHVDRAEVMLQSGEELAVDSLVFATRARDLIRAPTFDDGEALRLQACADLYEGPFLDGEDADWAIVERERLQSLYIQVLSRLAHLETRLGLYDEAIATTRNILHIDPFRESVHRDLLILFALNGERASAIRHFERLSVMLRKELNLQPTAETLSLIGVMRQEDYRGHFERLRGECFRQADLHA